MDNRPSTARRPSSNGPRRNELPAEEKQFEERTLHVDHVARVVKGGRRFRFRALVVIGDKKGKVGIGSAKGADVTLAVSKATDVAKKQLINVALYKGTLPHEAEAKVSGAHILIMPASSGTGLIAGGVVRSILEVTGVHNVLSKSLGSSNKTNIAYATIKALNSLVPAKDWTTAKNRAKTSPAKTAKKIEEAKEEIKEEVKKPVKKTVKAKAK
jgi:small subunit ribosomal protein S5